MLVLGKELEGESEGGLEWVMGQHCRRQKEAKVPVSAALLVGSRAGEDVWVLQLPLVPLPDTAASGDAAADPSQAKALKTTAECLDPEWVLQHAKQVLRCLPGGLDVHGVLLCGDKKALRELEPAMTRSLRLIRRASVKGRLGMDFQKTQDHQMFLVTMESPRGKPEAKALRLGDSSTASVRLSFQAARWVLLHSRFRLPPTLLRSAQSMAPEDFESSVRKLLQPLTRSVMEALPLFDDAVKDPDTPVLAAKAGKGQRKEESSSEPVEVDLLLDLGSSEEAGEGEAPEWAKWELDIGGYMEVWGLVEGRSHWDRAAEAVKEDVGRSLASRLLLHAEELLVVEGETAEAPREGLLHELPRRVALSGELPAPLPAHCPLSDYVFRGDEVGDVAENLSALFNLPLGAELLALSEEELAGEAEVAAAEAGATELLLPKARATSEGQRTRLLLLLLSVLVALAAFAAYLLQSS